MIYYRLLFLLLLICGPTTGFAGPSLILGGRILDGADGTNPVNSTWEIAHVDQVESKSTNITLSSGYWYGEVGHFFENLRVDDELVVLSQKETGIGLERKGYYGLMSTQLTGSDPAQLDDLIIREVPVPLVDNTEQGSLITIPFVSENAPVIGTNVLSWNIYSSFDGEVFELLENLPLSQTDYLHSNRRNNRYYAISLEIRGLGTTLLSNAVRRPYIAGDFNDDGVMELADAIQGIQVLTGAQLSLEDQCSFTQGEGIGADDILSLLHLLSE